MIDDATLHLTFEDAMRELESIVRDLETGKANLDNAVRAYERGGSTLTLTPSRRFAPFGAAARRLRCRLP